MVNKYYNLYYTLKVSMGFSIVLSCLFHIFFVIFLVYKGFFYIKVHSPLVKKDCGVITLFSVNDLNMEKILKQESLSKKTEIISGKYNLRSNIHKTYKVLKNSKSTSDSVDGDKKSDKNNNLNSDDSIFFESNSMDLNHATDNTIDSDFYIIKYFHPKYPNSARLLGIEGEVNVMYDINVMGRVEKIRILSSFPSGIFEENVRSAMRRWVYKSNQPKQNLTIIFKFSVNTK